MPDHEGHRQRLKNRYLKEGLDHFEEVQALELLLYYAIPRRDTVPIARALLERFGSIVGVLEAPQEALASVPGVGESAATLIQLSTDLARYYLVRRSSNAQVLDTVQKCGDFLVPRFFGQRDEMLYALFLDARCRLKLCKLISRGTIHETDIPVRKIAELALAAGASSVILAHNHSGGVALPSQEDVMATRQMAQALKILGVLLGDHLIVSGSDYISMAESGFYVPGN